MDKDLKKCPVCKTTEHPKADKKGHLCKPCATERATQWYKDNPERYFFNQIKAKYGINRLDYLSLLDSQDNKCAICNEEESAPNVHKKDQKRRLALDHDHLTGQIRGFLCYRCNTTLGKVKDNVELLQSMINYLEEHK